MSDFDNIQYGRLIEKLESTTIALNKMESHLATLSARMQQVEERYRLGRMGLTGLIIGMGFAVFGIKEVVLTLWGKWG